MTKQEFESRVKIEVSDDLFEKWNRVYMAAGNDIDKDTFCSAVKAAGKGNSDLFDLLFSLADRVNKLGHKCKERLVEIQSLDMDYKQVIKEVDALKEDNERINKELQEATTQRSKLVVALLDNGLDEEAINIAGHGLVIAVKASSGFEFNDRDREYLAEVFSKKQGNP